MDFYQKAKLADKFIELTKWFVNKDALYEHTKHVYAKNGTIFCTNGKEAFLTNDPCVNNFIGCYNEETGEFETIASDTILSAMDKTYNVLLFNLSNTLKYEDAIITKIEDWGEPITEKFEIEPDLIQENEEEYYNEEGEEPPKKKRKPRKKTKTVVKSFVKITFQNSKETFTHIFQKETMLHIIEAFKGMPTFKITNDCRQSACIKKNDQCKIEDDIFFLIVPYDPANMKG